jgi:hypothetical protein
VGPRALLATLFVALSGCSEPEVLNPLTCDRGLERFRGACLDPATRYEPAERVDGANVVAYGEPLAKLALPAPPKSGFRIIAPPRTMPPGGEEDYCLAWPFPSIKNRIVYGARIYTTEGLHHSNVVSKPIDPKLGPNPYPGCYPGASDPFSQLPTVIPDVLFANSTQVVGQETLALPLGMGFPVDPTREITTNIHYLNTTAEPQRVEVAYDFFTMPEEELTAVVAPFAMQVNDFLIPPHATGSVGATCDVFGGSVVSLMPHAHKLLQRFTVDLLARGGTEKRALEDGAFDAASDIRVYDPPLDLKEIGQIRFECTFNNTTDHDVVYGLGENEMCVLFGYLAPPRRQFVAYADSQGEPCHSFQIGLLR